MEIIVYYPFCIPKVLKYQLIINFIILEKDIHAVPLIGVYLTNLNIRRITYVTIKIVLPLAVSHSLKKRRTTSLAF